MGLGAGTVRMGFLNGQLEAFAARQDTTFSGLRYAGQATGTVWPWPFAGISVTWLGSSGTTHGREPERQNVSALGIEAQGVVSWSLLGWPLGAGAGVGAYWVTASGLVTGGGLAVGGHAGLEWRFLRWGPLLAAVEVRWRYLPVRSLHDERGPINTRGQPAADFSGLCIGLSFGWR